MAKTVAQINRELAQLKAQSQELGQALEELYGNYLDELSQVAYQQLISVCYQLCTQFYPDLFLKLSFKDRDRLQRQIKQQGQALKSQLTLEGLFQPDPAELEALEAALIDGLELIPGMQAEMALSQSSQELPTLEIPGLEAATSSPVDPSDSSPDLHAPDLHAPDLNLSGLASGEAETDVQNQDSPQGAPEDINESQPSDAQALDSQTSELQLPEGERIDNPFDAPSNLFDDQSPDAGTEGELSLMDGDSERDDSVCDGSERDGSERDGSERGDSERDGSERDVSEGDRQPDETSPRQLPITLIQSEDKTLSPGMLASAIAAEAEDDAAERPSPIPANLDPAEAAPPPPPETPQDVLLWQERLERTISQRLRQSSQRMTRLLEKSGVLNNQLPEGLLAASSDSDEQNSDSPQDERRQRRPEQGSNKSPHILTLMLEPAGGKKKKSKGDSIQIVAIYLRLAEIEFETPLVMGWRNRIRSQVKELKQLVREYEKTERERAIAEAEDAWRSTWSNE